MSLRVSRYNIIHLHFFFVWIAFRCQMSQLLCALAVAVSEPLWANRASRCRFPIATATPRGNQGTKPTPAHVLHFNGPTSKADLRDSCGCRLVFSGFQANPKATFRLHHQTTDQSPSSCSQQGCHEATREGVASFLSCTRDPPSPQPDAFQTHLDEDVSLIYVYCVL